MSEFAAMQKEDWVRLTPGLVFLALMVSIPAVLGFIAMRRGRSGVFFALGLIGTVLLLAIALPSIVPARVIARKNSCIANLKILSEAKRSWATLTKPETTTATQPSDLAPYLKGGLIPMCPTGGTYTLGAVHEPPRCSHADKGHTLTPPR